MSLVCDESTYEVSYDVTVAGRCIQVDVLGAGALNWRVPAGLFTWNQHERILSVLMQLFCAFHCKVTTTRCSLCVPVCTGITWYISVFTGFGYWCWRGSVKGMMSITQGVSQLMMTG